VLASCGTSICANIGLIVIERYLFPVYAHSIVFVDESVSPASYLHGGSGQDMLLEAFARCDQQVTNLVQHLMPLAGQPTLPHDAGLV
jgi:hypothetical protein